MYRTFSLGNLPLRILFRLLHVTLDHLDDRFATIVFQADAYDNDMRTKNLQYNEATPATDANQFNCSATLPNTTSTCLHELPQVDHPQLHGEFLSLPVIEPVEPEVHGHIHSQQCKIDRKNRLDRQDKEINKKTSMTSSFPYRYFPAYAP